MLSNHSNIKLLLINLLLSVNCVKAISPDCEVISYSERINANENVLNIEIDGLIQVNNPSGEKYTMVSIPYNKTQTIKSLNVWIEDTNRTLIRKIKNSEIKDASATSDITYYSDNFTRSFHVKHNRYPYRIKYSYTCKYDQYLGITDFSPVIDPSVPLHNAILQVEVPKGFDIKYLNKNVNNPEITANEKTITYIWKASYSGKLKKEKYSPPLHNFIPYVSVVPLSFNYGVSGSFKTWNDYGNWVHTLNDGLDILTPSEEDKIKDLVKDATDDYEKVRILYHYLQDNTRYIGVQIDIGGFKTYPAKYVCENKYGDCKALCNYMKSMLKSAGINSNYTLVYSNENPFEFDTTHVSQIFNHIILAVSLKDETLWLECTNNSIPVNYIGTSTQNRYALITGKERSYLAKTPSLSINNVQHERRIYYKVMLDGSAQTNFNIKAKGPLFEYLLSVKRHLNPYQQDQEVKSIINIPSFNLDTFSINQPHRDSSFLYLNADLSILNFTKRYGKDLIVKVLSANIPEFELPSKRKLPVQINYPIAQSDSIIVEIPESYSINTLPKNQKVSSQYGTYEKSFIIENNKIIICRRFTINPGHHLVSDYNNFYEFISNLNKLEKEIVLVLNE